MIRNRKGEICFRGFSPALFSFLRGLELNNSKGWFDEHRSEYLRTVLGPIKAFVRELGPGLALLDPGLETQPRVGRTISRINNPKRLQLGHIPYRPFLYITFCKGGLCAHQPLLYLGIFSHGVCVGFHPGRHDGAAASLQQAIGSNSKLFQLYLEQRRIAERYSELAGEPGKTARWPLPRTARRWASMDAFTIGEYFRCSDPELRGRSFIERSQEVFVDLFPLWVFASSDRIDHDLARYQRNVRALSIPLTKAGD